MRRVIRAHLEEDALGKLRQRQLKANRKHADGFRTFAYAGR
jgi:hypothetical protein